MFVYGWKKWAGCPGRSVSPQGLHPLPLAARAPTTTKKKSASAYFWIFICCLAHLFVCVGRGRVAWARVRWPTSNPCRGSKFSFCCVLYVFCFVGLLVYVLHSCGNTIGSSHNNFSCAMGDMVFTVFCFFVWCRCVIVLVKCITSLWVLCQWFQLAGGSWWGFGGPDGWGQDKPNLPPKKKCGRRVVPCGQPIL